MVGGVECVGGVEVCGRDEEVWWKRWRCVGRSEGCGRGGGVGEGWCVWWEGGRCVGGAEE